MKHHQSTDFWDRHLPQFKSVEEEAAFWDTHDSADFEDEFNPVDDVRFVPSRPRRTVTVRLDDETAVALQRKAAERGLTLPLLVREWIRDRLGSGT